MAKKSFEGSSVTGTPGRTFQTTLLGLRDVSTPTMARFRQTILESNYTVTFTMKLVVDQKLQLGLNLSAATCSKTTKHMGKRKLYKKGR